jgi:hypothetical protein
MHAELSGFLSRGKLLTNLYNSTGELVFISNAMTGTMPTHIGLLSKLSKSSRRLVSNILISITLPNIFFLSFLGEAALTIANTQLTGTLPTEVGNLVKLGKSLEV